MNQRLIIFTRYPEPHHTKTRLIPLLGPEGAAELQGEMTDHTLAWARELAGKTSVSVQVRFEGGDEARMRDRFGDSFPYLPQGPGDLGDRMTRAIEEAFAAGADRVIVVGTDCPGITSALAEEAFERLATADIVLGPATDGGYYLIGLRRPVPGLFAGVSWGRETVLCETVQRAQELGLAFSLLTPLSEVDRPEDLPKWHRAKCASQPPANPARISVIIPTLNEAGHLEDTLGALGGARNIETIVVDGGSDDGTDSLAAERGIRRIRSTAGRAHDAFRCPTATRPFFSEPTRSVGWAAFPKCRSWRISSSSVGCAGLAGLRSPSRRRPPPRAAGTSSALGKPLGSTSGSSLVTSSEFRQIRWQMVLRRLPTTLA